MNVYINTREKPWEKPHVHVSRGGKQHEGDLKYYLDERDFDPSTTAGFTVVELSKLRGYFALYHDECYADWVAIHGTPKKRG